MSVRIQAFENGPLVVEGRLRYRDGAGQLVETTGATAALCRCGRSDRGLLCDGSHQRADFSAGAAEILVEAEQP